MNESYTAYGDRRNPTTCSGSASSDDLSVSAGVTRQGYTWQTSLGNMGLNHMNGRVQDAITGVFLSPDPYISEPGNPQNYNRYSYVYNNPMSHTDPSGYSAYSDTVGFIMAGTTGSGVVGSPDSGTNWSVNEYGDTIDSRIRIDYGHGNVWESDQSYNQYKYDYTYSPTSATINMLAQAKNVSIGKYLEDLKRAYNVSQIPIPSWLDKELINLLRVSKDYLEYRNSIFNQSVHETVDAGGGKAIETGGVYVYVTLDGSIAVIPFNSRGVCGDNCMGIPLPDQSIGSPIMFGHPHPLAGGTLPSGADLTTSANLGLIGIIWPNMSGIGYGIRGDDIYFQGECLPLGCKFGHY